MVKRKVSTHLLFGVAFALLITIKNSWFSLVYWPFWLGFMAGLFIPYIDAIFYVYLLRPYELTSQRVKYLLAKKQYKQASILIKETRSERKVMIIHSFLFEIVLIVLAFLIVTSSKSILGSGLVMGIFLHLLVDQLGDYINEKNLNSWYLNLESSLSFGAAKYYLISGIVIFLVFVFFV